MSRQNKSPLLRGVAAKAKATGKQVVEGLVNLGIDPEFRIVQPAMPGTQSIENFIRQQSKLKGTAPRDPRLPVAEPDPAALNAIGKLAVFVWDVQRRAAQNTATMDRKFTSAIDRMAAGLAELGIVIEDYEGKKYVDGSAMEVIAFQPKPNLTAKIVAETKQPGVFFKGQHIVRGRVYVNTPEDPPEIPAQAAPTPLPLPEAEPEVTPSVEPEAKPQSAPEAGSEHVPASQATPEARPKVAPLVEPEAKPAPPQAEAPTLQSPPP